jgi:hypothetical protein
MTFEDNVRLAEIRVDAMYHADGFADRELLTILLALEEGLRCGSGSEYDAFVMLRDIALSTAHKSAK